MLSLVKVKNDFGEFQEQIHKIRTTLSLKHVQNPKKDHIVALQLVSKSTHLSDET